MKKITLIFSFIGIIGTALCQSQSQSYDSSFKALYKAVALHPGYMNSRGIINDSVIKRWDKDIKIYVEGGSGKSKKEILNKLKTTIELLSPALNKIKISFTNDKSSANYLININSAGTSNWYVKWDGLFNIYSCTVLINTTTIFNYDEQAGLVSHYFLQTLGDFVFSKKDRPVFTTNNPSAASNMSLWRQDITNLDLQIVKLHYSDNIKTGMSAKDIDQFFDKH